MLNASILQNFSDDDFAAKAFADYLEDVSESYTSLVALMQEVVDADPILDEQGDVDVSADSAMIDNIITTAGVASDTVITLPQGYSTAAEFLHFLRNQALAYSDVITVDPVAALTDATLTLRDQTGQLKSNFTTTYVQAIADVKSSMHSIVCSAAAVYASLENNVADRLTVFKERVAKTFANTYDDLSNFAASCRSMLSNAASKASDICRGMIDTFQILARPARIQDTKVYEYTGASPVCALDYSTALKVASSTGSIIGAGLKIVFEAIYDKLGQVGVRVVKKVATLANPINLEVINADEHAAPSVNQLEYQFSHDIVTLPFIDVPSSSEAQSFLNDHANVWLKYKFVLGEVLLKYDEATITDIGGVNFITLTKAVFKLKPYACKAWNLHYAITQATGLMKENISGTNYMYEFSGNVSIDQLNRLIQLLEQDPDLYVTDTTLPTGDTTDSWNRELYNGCSLAIGLMLALLHCGSVEVVSSYSETSFNPNLMGNVVFEELSSPDLASNLTFAQVFSGYYNYQEGGASKTAFIVDSIPARRAAVSAGYLPGNTFLDNDAPDETQSKNLLYDLLGAIILQAYDRSANPLDYVFLPYRVEKEGFDTPYLHIRTDQENQEAFTKFCSIVVAVVVAVAVTVVVGIAVKKIARAAYFKKAQFVGQMDNKMWSSNGAARALTTAEQRKYLRYSRKLNASSLISDSIQSASSNTASSLVSNLYDNLNQGEVISFNTITDIIAGR